MDFTFDRFDRVFVAFSGGKDSVASFIKTREKFPLHKICLVFTDTGHEMPETYQYLKWFNQNVFPVVRLKDGNWERVTEQFFQFKEDAIGYTAEHSLWNNGYLYALVDGCELTHIFIAGKQVYPSEGEWR